MGKRKNAAAVALARRRLVVQTPERRQEISRSGGLIGGKVRAEKLSAARRKAIAQKAAAARWGKKGK
jgi:hypothetical protein